MNDLRRSFEGGGAELIDELLSAHEEAPDSLRDRNLRCRACGHGITRSQDRIDVNGAQVHSFTNPAGIRFRIGCFREAQGGREIGEATGEYTWFPGYRWRIMLCGRCGSHLGWGFHSDGGDRFCGLVLDRLSDLN